VRLLFFIALCACLLAPRGHAEDAPALDVAAKDERTAASEASLAKGLAWLASQQDGQGAWSEGNYPVAVTSLACLAFMADGSLPGRGPFGDHVHWGIEYILNCGERLKSGYITEAPATHSRMHGHALATLLLAEAYGMSDVSPSEDEARIGEALRNAVRVIERAQTAEGGWWYDSVAGADEASVTSCCLVALRAARDARIPVSQAAIEKGIHYLQKCTTRDGSCVYSVSMGQASTSFALTAGAVASLAMLGAAEGLPYTRALDYLMKHEPPRVVQASYYFYGSLFSSLAVFHARGANWSERYPEIRDRVITDQTAADGSWEGEVSPEYCTACACLILALPHRYLSIFQR